MKSCCGIRDIAGGVCLTTFASLVLLQGLAREKSHRDEAGIATLAQAKLDSGNLVTGDWPQWRGPRRDGITAESVAPWPKGGPRKLWEAKAGEGYSAMAIALDTVYAFFQSGPDETLAAFDRATGESRWRFAYPALYANNYGNGPRSTPTVDAGRVYIVGGTGILHCIDAVRGAKLWRKDLGEEYQAPPPTWGIAYSPLVEGDMLIVHPGGKEGGVVALDKATGKEIWRALDDGGGYSSPIAAEIEGQRQLLVFTAKGLVGLDLSAGTLLWRFDWKTPWDCNIVTPIVAGSYVFLTSGYDRGCALVRIAKHEAGWKADRVYEHQRFSSHFATPVLRGETLYGFHESSLTAMDLRTGKIKWRQRGFGKGSLLAAGDHLLVLGETGDCVLVKTSPEAYQEAARFTFSENRCWTMPTLAHGLLYLRDQEKLVCFQTK